VARSVKGLVERVLKRLVRGFGITQLGRETGVIIPYGRYLDFSGRALADNYEWSDLEVAYVPKDTEWNADDLWGMRRQSHEEMLPIADPHEDEPLGDGQVEDILEIFGIIRVNGLGGIQVMRLPTEPQFRAIGRLIKQGKDYGRPAFFGLDVVVTRDDDKWIHEAFRYVDVRAHEVISIIRKAFKVCCNRRKKTCCPHSDEVVKV
jgi:hypothetical protein